MNPERWQEVQRLFAAARDQATSKREAFLWEQSGDRDVVEEVLRLLAASPPEGFLEPPAVEAPTDGHQLDDFVLGREIGRGGMGVVYLARQGSLKRTVAVKVLPANLTLSQRQIDRFQREARAAARLHHPGIVSILTVGECKGTHFFAMEYVPGRNLAEELLRLRNDLGAPGAKDAATLPDTKAPDYFRTVAEIVRQAADALHYAHQHGVVHRDIKPSNLLLDPERSVKLVDFGLARDEEQGALSKTSEAAGTAHYMSPEQAREQAAVVDHRTDVYSLGVVLFELLTLRRPFEGRTEREVRDGIIERDPPRIRRLNGRVPRDLEVICAKAMAKGLKDRYRDAGAFRDDLMRFLAHEAIHAQPPGAVELVMRKLRRHWKPVLATGLAISTGVAGIVWADARADRRRREGLEEEIRAALAKGPLSTLPLSQALRLRGLVDEVKALRPRGVVLAADAGDPLLAFASEFEAWHEDMKSRGLEDLAIAKDASEPEGVREFHLLRGQQTLLQASHLFPDDLELRQLAAVESAFPTIAVEARDEAGNPVSAEVFLRTIDVLTSGVGPGLSIGKTPLAATPVRPGYYRVVVKFEVGGSRELVCNPSYAFTEVKLVAMANGELRSGEGMVRFEAGEYTLPDDPGIHWPLEGKTVHLDAFLIDKTEVSNAQYAEFVRATGHPLPSYWKFVEDRERFLAEYGDRPVVGVGWRDAVAYAEWCGKRLPTAAEWLRAAGGVENRPFPYSADPAAPLLGNVHGPIEPTGGETQCWEQYLQYSAPVASHPEAATPEGIYHLYGNAFELTETMMVEGLDVGFAVPRPFDRLALGGNWRSQASSLTMRSGEHWSVGPSNDYFYLGFRCAKSVGP